MNVAAWVPLSFTPLIALAIICITSLAVFLVLTRRWTEHRQLVELGDWAKAHEFSLRFGARAIVPPPLSQLPRLAAHVRWQLSNDTTVLVQLQTAIERTGPSVQPTAYWNALIRTMRSNSPPTGLRPSSQQTSLLDLFSLGSFPLMAAGERFTVFGTDDLAARRLFESQAAGLLPPDIGILRYGEYLLLDFSMRPFDPIEFGRMLSLADQLEKHT